MSDTTKKFHQYFSTRPVINITMPNTRKIKFVGGVYMTDNQSEIDFLDAEIKNGHPMIFVKQGQETVDADALDPLAAVRKKAVEDYLAQQKLAMDPKRDMGSTVSAPQAGMTTTAGIASITAGSKSK